MSSGPVAKFFRARFARELRSSEPDFYPTIDRNQAVWKPSP
jgi:hypothetical protein